MPTFLEIPDTNRSPAVLAEFDPQGEPGANVPHALLIGTRLSSGTVAALTPTLVFGETQGDGFHGEGSQLARMLRAFKKVNPNAKVTSIGVAEPGAGTAASGNLALSGPATEDGVLALYIAGERVEVAVSNGDADTVIALAIEAAIDGNTQLPVTSSVVDDDVTVTCRWKGVTGNDIDIAINLRPEDKLPAGVGIVITPMASGAGAPDLTTVTALLEETVYDSIVTGFADDTALDVLEAEVKDRWTAMRALDGHVFAAARGDASALIALGDARNSEASTLIGLGESPSAPWIAAAQVAGLELSISDPGVPRFGLVCPDLVAPATDERFDHATRNLLLFDGVSTLRVDGGGRVIIDRLITTWQENAFGGADTTWLPLTRRRVASLWRRSWVALLQAKYPNYKLVDDGTQLDPGVRAISPSVLKSEALAFFKSMERQGHVEDFEAFRASLTATRPSGDPERVDVYQEPNFSNELVTIATKVAFKA